MTSLEQRGQRQYRAPERHARKYRADPTHSIACHVIPPSTTELDPTPLATPAPKSWKTTSTSRLRPEKAGYFLVELFRTRNGARRPKCPVNEAIDSGDANVDASGR